MPKSQSQSEVEATGRSPATPTVEQQPKLPEKQSGPAQVRRAQATQSGANGTGLPPGGNPVLPRAAGVVANPDGAGAAGRARVSRALQRQVGNARLSRMLSTAVQPQLTVGAANDVYEQEADQVADRVMRMPQPLAQGGETPAATGAAARQPLDEAERRPDQASAMQRRVSARPPVFLSQAASGPVPEVTPELESHIAASKGGGEPLPESARAFAEPRFGQDFSGVRVHTNTAANRAAQSLNAQAFTSGQDIYFGAGSYQPGTQQGDRLIAHELTHVVQQGQSANTAATLRRKNGTPTKPEPQKAFIFKVTVREKSDAHASLVITLMQVYGVDKATAESFISDKHWHWIDPEYKGFTAEDARRGYQSVQVAAAEYYDLIGQIKEGGAVEREAGGRRKGATTRDSGLKKLPPREREAVNKEADRQFQQRTGAKPGTKLGTSPQDKIQADLWIDIRDKILADREKLAALPDNIKSLMQGKRDPQPKDYEHLLRIAEKLKAFTTEDFAVYKLLAIRATDNLDLFEKSVDMYLARKEELKRALEEEQKKRAAGSGKEPTMQEAIAEKWRGLDEPAIGKMSEAERYRLARQKTDELTKAQLKYMKEHPGETLKGFAKAATLVNTGETFSAIGKDLAEVAKGDANTWARWAAGAGAGAKLSGWLLAVAGILYVASWLTGIGELATIAAAAGILLGTTLTLSMVESELRIKAASQAKTPEEFKRNVELAAAAQANVIVGVALIVVAAVLHFTAKALFPKTLQNIKTSLKNFRERVRLKGSVYELKPGIKQEMAVRKADLAKASGAAKQQALRASAELEGLSAEQFVEKLERGDGGFLDQSKLPAEQKVNFRELLKTPEGRKAIEGYRQRLVKALKTDVPAEIDRLAQEYGSKIDDFLKDVDAAKNHDELGAAADKLESALGEEHAKEFMKKEQEAITKRKLEEAAAELEKEVATAKAAAAQEWLSRFENTLSSGAKKQLQKARAGKTDLETQAFLEKKGGKAYLERQAKGAGEAIDVAKEAEAKKALDRLASELPDDVARAKLSAIRRNSPSDLAVKNVIDQKGGKEFLTREARTAAEKQAARAEAKAQSAALLPRVKQDLKQSGFLQKQEVKRVLEGNGAFSDKANALQGLIGEELAARAVQAEFAGQPNIRIYRSIRIIREQAGFKKVQEYLDAIKAKTGTDYTGQVFARDGKVYTVSAEIDILVVEETPGKPARIRYREEAKSGRGFSPSEAQKQLDKQAEAFRDLAAGDKSLHLELPDKTDITSRIDPASDSTAIAKARGPRIGGFEKSLDLTADDLYKLAQDLVKELSSAAQESTGGIE